MAAREWRRPVNGGGLWVARQDLPQPIGVLTESALRLGQFSPK